MKTTAQHRSPSIAFKCEVVQEYLSGETLRGLAERHDLPRSLVRVWVQDLGLPESHT
nr:helix-turn-helix domain-containing protein [Methylobacterium sp. BE186]